MEQTSSFYETSSGANPAFWANGVFRKRKAAVSDLDEKSNPKMFATEEKMVKDMRTLSLDLVTNSSNLTVSPEPVDEEVIVDEMRPEVLVTQGSESSDDERTKSPNVDDSNETRFEFHPILQDSLKKEDLNDRLISKLCEMERKKLSMQIVPFIPIHPAQLTSDSKTTTNDDKSTDDDEKQSLASSSSSSLSTAPTTSMIDEFIDQTDDDQIFKRPWAPTPYTVEEPNDKINKRSPTMKRSFSQCNQYNSNYAVTELKHDTKDDLALSQCPTPYFIVEPSVATSTSSLSSGTNSSAGLSSRITEYFDQPLLPTATTMDGPASFDLAVDDDIDMQSVASSDTGDKMDDD